MDFKIPIVVIVGTTACGKTELAIEICKKYNGEAVSADSMQIYKRLDIGTAKPTDLQLSEVKHHMINIVEPYDSFSVAQYCEYAHKVIEEINRNKKLPVLVGGTGLYINSLVNNIDFIELNINYELRQELTNRVASDSVDALIDEIEITDPSHAEILRNEKNEKRIIRILEIIKTTGKPFRDYLKATQRKKELYNPLFIGLTYKNREMLYEKINKRIDIMLEKGLIDEAKYVMTLDDNATAKSAIGYKELFDYLNGTKRLDECVEDLKRASRKYAKRQLTWFKKNKNINWIFLDDYVKDDNIVDVEKIYHKAEKLLESWQNL